MSIDELKEWLDNNIMGSHYLERILSLPKGDSTRSYLIEKTIQNLRWCGDSKKDEVILSLRELK